MKKHFALLVLTIMFSFVFLLNFNISAQVNQKNYIFGHSLIWHVTQTNPNEHAVPYWLHLLAQASGNTYSMSGRFGTLNVHGNNLPATSNWGMNGVTQAWTGNQTFSQVNFDNVLISPDNYIQWQAPTAPYWNDTISPLSYTRRVFNWVNLQSNAMKYYIYESWPEMTSTFGGFPPSPAGWLAYNNYSTGTPKAFHDWFLAYHDSLIVAYPNNCVKMIPVGPTLGKLLQQSPYNGIASTTLYEDDAPHGRPTKYFLASLVTFMAMYEHKAPASFVVPSSIDPIIANNYQQVVDFIWNELLNFKLPSGQSRVFCNNPTSSLKTNSEENILTIYPNPLKTNININSTLPILITEVLDPFGNIVLKSKLNNIDFSSVSNGVYYCKITFLNGQVSVKKIVKQ